MLRKIALVLLFVILPMIDSFGRGAVRFNVRACKEENQASIQKSMETILKESSERDVSRRAKYALIAIEKYCPAIQVARAKSRVGTWVRVGHMNEIKKLAAEVEEFSNYRSPAPELDLIKIQEQKLKALGSNFRSPISAEKGKEYIRKGMNSSKNRKRSCTNIDNRKPPLTVKAKNNTRDQDSVGWCYAYTAADLISHKTGLEISAVDIANAYNDESWSNFFGVDESAMKSGYTADAANIALAKGVCLERNLPSEDFKFSRLGDDIQKGLRAVENLYADYQKATRNSYTSQGMVVGGGAYIPPQTMSLRKRGEQLRRAEQEFMANAICSTESAPWTQLFPTLKDRQILSLIRRASSNNEFVDSLVNLSCKPRISNSKKLKFTQHTKSVFNGGNAGMLNKIDQQLKSGNIVGIHYYSSVLKNRHYRRKGFHASSIVARRFNEKKGSCEFMVRNSWGTACMYDSYHQCKEGHIWVGEEYIADATSSIIHAN